MRGNWAGERGVRTSHTIRLGCFVFLSLPSLLRKNNNNLILNRYNLKSNWVMKIQFRDRDGASSISLAGFQLNF